MAKSEGRVHHRVSGKITRFVVASSKGIDQDAATFIKIRKNVEREKRECGNALTKRQPDLCVGMGLVVGHARVEPWRCR